MKEKLTYNQDDLAVLIKNRDQKAFGTLYDNYSKAIYGVIHNVVLDIEESEDILQKTFIKVWNNFDSYDSNKGRLYTWMLNIARNLSIDYKRSKSSKNKNQNIDENVNTLHNVFADDENHNTIGLKKVVGQLKTEYEIIIELAYYQGYTQVEISKELDIPLGTVKTRMRKALLLLRAQLQDKIQAS